MDKSQLLALEANGQHVDMATYFEIHKILHRETYLLNHEKLENWVALLADDLIYWAPLRENILRRNLKSGSDIAVNRMSLFEETKETLILRLVRNNSGMCWTEDPPTRQVTAISNIEAFITDKSDEFEVHSVFSLYRSRFERDDSTLMGRRKDIWRKTVNGFQLAGRLILLQQSTLLTKNLNVFI